MSTLSEMRTEVMSIIGMSGEDEEALVDGWLNQGTSQVVTRTGCEMRTAVVALDAEQDDYESDEDIISTLEIYNLTDSRTLERVTFQELIEMRTYGQATGGVCYYASKADTFSFYPTPDEETQLKLYYVPQPSLLDDDDDEPDEVPREWHFVIVYWALHRAGDWDDDGSSGQGERYLKDFKEGISDMKRAMNRKAGHRLASMKVNPRGRNVPFSDPSRPIY